MKLTRIVSKNLVRPGQAQILPLPDLLVIVPKSHRCESDSDTQKEPNKNIPEVGPEQSRDNNTEIDEHPAHGRRTGFRLVGLRPIFPNILADLKLLEQPHQPRTQSRESNSAVKLA